MPESYDRPTLRETARSLPAETALLSVLPVALAFTQLGIGVVTDLHLGYAAAFAAVLVAYSVFATRYNCAVARLETLQ